MTLNDLIRKANDMAMQLSSGDVPLEHEAGLVRDIDLILLSYENGDPFINIEIWNETD